MPNKQQRLLLGPLPLFLACHSQCVAHRSSICFVLLDGTSLQQKQFLIRPYHMLFKPSGFCNIPIQSQNTSRPARRATARGTVTWGLYGFQFFFFSHNAPTFVTGISMQRLGDSNNRNACSFFFARRHKLPHHIHQVFRAQRSTAWSLWRPHVTYRCYLTCRSVS